MCKNYKGLRDPVTISDDEVILAETQKGKVDFSRSEKLVSGGTGSQICCLIEHTALEELTRGRKMFSQTWQLISNKY